MERRNTCYEYALCEEMEILVELLENSTDENQQQAIVKMLCEMVRALNHKG